MTSAPLQRLTRLLLPALLLCSLSTLVAPARAEPRPTVTARLAFGSAAPQCGYMPILFEILWIEDDPAAPRTLTPEPPRPAALTITTPQDSFYRVTIQTPILLQTGVTTQATVMLRTARMIGELDVTLRDQQGDSLFSGAIPIGTRFGTVGFQSRDSIRRILTVGRQTLSSRRWIWSNPDLADVELIAVDPALFPQQWIGLEDTRMVVIGDLGTDTLTGPQRQALMQWVSEGGLLIVLAAPDRSTFDDLFPVGTLPLQLGEIDLYATASDLGETMKAEVDALLANVSGAPARLAELGPALLPLGDAPVAQRLITLTPDAAEAGWTTRSLGLAPHLDAANVAVGPFGLGRIVIVGVAPEALPGPAAPPDASAVVWWMLMEVDPGFHESVRSAYFNIASRSTYDPVRTEVNPGGRETVNAMLDLASRDFEMGRGLFDIMAGAILLLVVLLGPVDYFLFKRLHRLPWTWWTAVVWVAATGGLILLAQRTLRTGDLTVNRVSLLTVYPWSDQVRCLGITGIQSDVTREYRFADAPLGRYFAPAAWVNPWEFEYPDTNGWNRVFLIQAGGRQNLASLGIPMGSARWVEDRGYIAKPPVTVNFTNINHSTLNFTASLPADAAAQRIEVLHAGRIFRYDETTSPAQLAEGIQMTSEPVPGRPGSQEREAWEEYADRRQNWDADESWLHLFGPAASVPEGWSVIRMEVTGLPPDVAIEGIDPADIHHRTFLQFYLPAEQPETP